MIATVSARRIGTVLAASSLLAAFPAAAEVSGKAVWEGTCALCHTEPMSGAPQFGDAAAWAPRLAKGSEALYASAINGFIGPKGDEMPARGGNDSLSDAEVRAAVDYMLASAGAK
ncbi:MAG: c-type cytochrome [Zoogloeaceae bacterium]|nr:c-type cytochrome [Zoogloeaceae bacterium]